MSQQQETEIDRLVSVIQVIQLGRKTGMLIARRGEGSNLEEGTIKFVNGRATETQLGRHKGPEAFNLLSLWEACQFTFASSNPQDKLVFHPAPQSPTQTSPVTDAKLPAPFIAISPLRAHVSPSPQPEEPVQTQQTLPPPVTQQGIVIPHRSRQLNSALQVVENMQLSRMHRQILLLIDGQRSSADLARLTRRSHEEIYKVLQELERVAAIQIQR